MSHGWWFAASGITLHVLQHGPDHVGGQVVEFKHVFYSWVCMAVLFVVAYLVRRRLTLVPGGHAELL